MVAEMVASAVWGEKRIPLRFYRRLRKMAHYQLRLVGAIPTHAEHRWEPEPTILENGEEMPPHWDLIWLGDS